MPEPVPYKFIYKYEFIAMVKFIQAKGVLTLDEAINWVEKHFSDIDDVVIRIRKRENEENGNCKNRSI